MRQVDTRGSRISLSVASFMSTDILNPISGPLILWTVLRSPPEQKVLASFSAPLRIRATPSVQVSSSSTTCSIGGKLIHKPSYKDSAKFYLKEVHHHGSRHCIPSFWVVKDHMGDPTLRLYKVN